jgi:hypothetical protein
MLTYVCAIKSGPYGPPNRLRRVRQNENLQRVNNLGPRAKPEAIPKVHLKAFVDAIKNDSAVMTVVAESQFPSTLPPEIIAIRRRLGLLSNGKQRKVESQ